MVVGAAGGLAVDGDHFTWQQLGQRLYPATETAFQRLRIQQGQDPTVGVVRGDAVWQVQEGG